MQFIGLALLFNRRAGWSGVLRESLLNRLRLYVALDGEHHISALRVGSNGNGLVDAAHTVGIVLHLDHAAFTGKDRLFWTLGNSTSAAALTICDHQRLLAGVCKFEFALAVFTLFEVAVIMRGFIQLDVGKA